MLILIYTKIIAVSKDKTRKIERYDQVATFATRLKELRKEKSLTQKGMAQIFQMSENGYQNYEIGRSTPHYEVLMNFADYFNVSLDYLTGRSEVRERQ